MLWILLKNKYFYYKSEFYFLFFYKKNFLKGVQTLPPGSLVTEYAQDALDEWKQIHAKNPYYQGTNELKGEKFPKCVGINIYFQFLKRIKNFYFKRSNRVEMLVL